MAASIVSEHLVKDRTIISDINGQNVEVFFSYLQSDILRNIVKILLGALRAKPISKFLNNLFLRKVLFCLSVDGIPIYRMLFN